MWKFETGTEERERGEHHPPLQECADHAHESMELQKEQDNLARTHIPNDFNSCTAHDDDTRTANANAETKEAKIIQWEVYEEELVRLWSLSSGVRKASTHRDTLLHKLDAILQVRRESLSRSNKLEAMHGKLALQRQTIECGLISLKEMSQVVQVKEEKLKSLVRSLMAAAKALSAAYGRLQEANRLLAGEGGNSHLRHLKKMLCVRQQLMVTQIASIYPLARYASHRVPAEESKSVSPQITSGEFGGSSSLSTNSDSPVESLTIAGLQLIAPQFKKLRFFNDKLEFQSSATAIGYVSHIVKLIASYLNIPLRYPLRLGGSRSFIQDHASSVEPSITESGTFGMSASQKPVVEFPLFSEGQDPTRSAYAVFLLNKDLDQLLSYVGVPSCGPRHTLPNLKKLIKTILSERYSTS